MITSSVLGQERKTINATRFKFDFQLKSGGRTNSSSNSLNIYSFDDLMLLEIPIYRGQNLVTPEADQKEIAITDIIANYKYVLVDQRLKKAWTLKSLDDKEYVQIDFNSVKGEIFSFNEKFIEVGEGAKLTTSKIDNLQLEEYRDAGSPSNVTKLFFSKSDFGMSFTFSESLEKVKKLKLVKIIVQENQNGSEQLLTWELSNIAKPVADSISDFFEKWNTKKD